VVVVTGVRSMSGGGAGVAQIMSGGGGGVGSMSGGGGVRW
jgi:hypothetical protein